MLVIGFLFAFTTPKCFAQEHCTHVVTSSHPSKIIGYLTDTYGSESTEHHLMQIRAYEVLHDVKVLLKEDYLTTIATINLRITETNDPIHIQELENRKNRFVSLSSIETELF